MNKIDELLNKIKQADAIAIGGGSGMSNAAGMDFWYTADHPLFHKYFDDFYKKYHFNGLFEGYYNQFDTLEEKWAFFLTLANFIKTVPPQKPTYDSLKKIIGDKPYHIITTNQDGIFKKYFPADKVSEIQGSWDYLQSSNPNTDKNLYPLDPILKDLLPKIHDNKLDSKYFPKSPVDGAMLTNWIRGPEFLEDKKYNEEHQKFNKFIGKWKDKKVLFLEMGVGRMSPMFIQEPFWEMTQYIKDSFYININPKDAKTNPMIATKSLLIDEDINEVLQQASKKIKEENHD